jgi:hypothetical protein
MLTGSHERGRSQFQRSSPWQVRAPPLGSPWTTSSNKTGGEWDGHRYVSTTAPTSDFWERLNALIPYAHQLLGLPMAYSSNVSVSHVELSYGEGDHLIAETHLRKVTAAGEGSFSTPAVANERDYSAFQSRAYVDALSDLQVEALFYASGLKKKQHEQSEMTFTRDRYQTGVLRVAGSSAAAGE